MKKLVAPSVASSEKPGAAIFYMRSSEMKLSLIAAGITAMALTAGALAQGGRDASPPGTAATQVGGHYEHVAGIVGPVYTSGKWIEITYGRPFKHGRDLWGSGADYGKMLNSGAPVWRAGANVTTQLKTEAPLIINGKTVDPGTYTMFIDLKPNNWTLIVSNWRAQTHHDPKNTAEIWGAFGYTPDKDVVRVPMTTSTLPWSVDQLTWEFADMTDAGGKITIMWDKTAALVPFKVGM